MYIFRFLGYIDKIGVAYEAPSVASGYGAYIAQVSYIDKIGVAYEASSLASGCGAYIAQVGLTLRR